MEHAPSHMVLPTQPVHGSVRRHIHRPGCFLPSALLTEPEAGRIFVLLTIWDSAKGSTEFFEAFEVFAGNKTGGNPNVPGGVTQRIWVTQGETIALSLAETSALLIIGDDESAVHQVLSLATGP